MVRARLRLYFPVPIPARPSRAGSLGTSHYISNGAVEWTSSAVQLGNIGRGMKRKTSIGQSIAVIATLTGIIQALFNSKPSCSETADAITSARFTTGQRGPSSEQTATLTFE